MPKLSAGILCYRYLNGILQVLLVHPGGPFWAKKDKGAWSIPKGEYDHNELPLAAALRELEEETRLQAEGYFIELTPVRQKSGKVVAAFATKIDIDPASLTSNTFELEWPPGSGIKKSFPEIDRAAWFEIKNAATYILESQQPLLDELEALMG